MAKKTVQLHEPPDGGWGWFVVAGGFICTALSAGTFYAFGVLYVAFLDAFGASRAKTAWIGSVFVMALINTHPITMALIEKIGHRKTTMLGGVLGFTGILSSSFATGLTMITFTFGIGAGIGLSLTYMASIDIASKYFKRRLSLAVGLVLAGSGAGQCGVAILCQYLLNTYGWRGTLMIFSAITLNLCVAASIYRPLEVKTDVEVKSTNDTQEISVLEVGTNTGTVSTETVEDEGTGSKPLEVKTDVEVKFTNVIREISVTDVGTYTGVVGTNTGTGSAETVEDENNGSQKTTERNRCLGFISSLWDLSLFREPVFVVILLCCCGEGLGSGTVTVHNVSRAVDYGISPTMGALIPAVMGLTQLVARPLSGVLGNTKTIDPYIVFGTALAISGVASIISTYTRTFAGQAIYIIIFGITSGCTTVYIPLVIAFYLGRDRVGYGTALCLQLPGITIILAGPLAGFIQDESGGYEGAFWLAGITITISGLLAFCLPAVERVVKRRNRQQYNKDEKELQCINVKMES